MKTIVILAAAVLLSLGFAQERSNTYWMTAVLAQEFDTLVIDCPDALTKDGVDFGCYMDPLGAEWARMDLDHLVREFTDIEWTRPWEADTQDGPFFRSFRKTSSPTGVYVVAIMTYRGGALGVLSEVVMP